MTIEATSARLRPRRAAIRPNSQLPTGRITNPAANTPAVLRSCAVGSEFGKNAGAKYTAQKA